MSYDYSENILVQKSAGDLLRDELGWDVQFAYNTEVLGKNGTFGRTSYHEILLTLFRSDPVFSECSAAAQPVDDGFAAFRGAENAGKPPFHGVPPASQRGKVLSPPGRHPRHGEKAERSAGNEASRGDRLSKPGE